MKHQPKTADTTNREEEKSSGSSKGSSKEGKRVCKNSSTRTKIPSLFEYNNSNELLFWLVHIQQRDKWSCGYRNLQMLLSAVLPRLSLSNNNQKQQINTTDKIPSLKELQEYLENAWKMGLDSKGADHYGGSIVGKSDEIGAVEVNTILTSLYIDSVVIQFIRTKESRNLLGPFVWNYFNNTTNLDKSSCSNQIAEQIFVSIEQGNNDNNVNNNRITTAQQQNNVLLPLYLQWEGHSVTVIGIQKLENGSHQLLVFDPAKDGRNIKRILLNSIFNTTTNNNNNILSTIILNNQKQQIANKDCQLVLTTSHYSLNDSHIHNRKRRVNAVTAARQSVMKQIGGL
mmetsp:Transcript_24662/g.27236  ORF Transcript_24662/g.27236 Transcript_24662/m.27236 type:complete len:342 (+) Transcript_24662:232-1257(+)